jgi:hypothetical protein
MPLHTTIYMNAKGDGRNAGHTGSTHTHTHMVAQRKGSTHLTKETKEGVKKYGTQAIYRTTHRDVTYRLTDDGDSVTKVGDVGDHIANDGGIEQRTQKEVG